MVKKGDYVRTPRFLMVRIEDVYDDERTMRKNGYTEPTHYWADDCVICGKSIGQNRMLFAACNKRKDW